jgi:hypothetical protein
MTPDRAFDLIVLGGGPAGTSGARARLRRSDTASFGHPSFGHPSRSSGRAPFDVELPDVELAGVPAGELSSSR